MTEDHGGIAAHRDRRIETYYDRLAPVYGEGAYFQARRVAVLEAIAPELQRARSVLDLGCGNGTFVAEFAKMSSIGNVIGADLSSGMLAAARRRLGPCARLVRADATALPLATHSVDVVFMSHVLMLVSDVDGCLAEVARCLTPNGIVIATVGVGRLRSDLHSLLHTPQWRALIETLVPRLGLEIGTDDDERYGAACRHAGLRPRSLTPSFTLEWPAVEEWVRIRWLSMADETQRAVGEELLAQVRACGASETLTFHEPLLLADKPAAL